MNMHGYSLLEVLVALVLVSIALLGLAGLQIHAQQAQLESYQRAQAMLLVEDMINRVALNRAKDILEQCYGISDPQTGVPYLGTGNSTNFTCIGAGISDTKDLADADIAAWDDMLKGANEQLADDDSPVGGLAGARGCIYFSAGPPESVTVTVAWQGESETAVPADNCAKNLYGDDDRLRRTVSDTIRFAELDS